MRERERERESGRDRKRYRETKNGHTKPVNGLRTFYIFKPAFVFAL